MSQLQDFVNKWSFYYALEPNLLELRKAMRKEVEDYASECVRHNLAKAADQAKVQYFVVGEKTDVGELTARVDKESILKLEIELI